MPVIAFPKDKWESFIRKENHAVCESVTGQSASERLHTLEPTYPLIPALRYVIGSVIRKTNGRIMAVFQR